VTGRALMGKGQGANGETGVSIGARDLARRRDSDAPVVSAQALMVANVDASQGLPGNRHLFIVVKPGVVWLLSL
jgi:hypothetical protein